MNTLQRMTTSFDEAQDRLRIAGELQGDQKIVLWLTRRLIVRLVPHLCKWLDQQVEPSPLSPIRQEFAQQKAKAEIAPQAPVLVDTAAIEALVYGLDLKTTERALFLLFKDADGQEIARLAMPALPLRQWLNILHVLCQKANWQMDVWPEWLSDANSKTSRRQRPVLH